MNIISIHRLYNDEKIQEEIKPYGFQLIEFIDTKNIIAQDSTGYKYKLTLCNLKDGKKPNRFMRNPFALENFRLYLSLNHPNYILLDDEYHGCKAKMRFMCINHPDKGIQLNSIDNIVNSHHACKYCSYEKCGEQKRIDENILKELCNEKHVEYIGRDVKNHETVVRYRCFKHPKHIQEMSLTHFRTSVVPCQYCGISEGESIIYDYLTKHNINFIHDHKFPDCYYIDLLKFDFYLPDYNKVIEYDGRQHFEPVKFWNGQDAEAYHKLVMLRDNIKNQYCKKNNIKMLRIPYTQFKNLEKILDDEIIESSETAG